MSQAERAIGIEVPHAAIAEFCRQRGIRRLAFFGSVLRDDFRPDSDVDVLVEFLPGRVPGLFAMVDYEMGLSKLEVKGQDSDQDRTKREFLAEWVAAVNEHGGFGRWAADVSFAPGDVVDVLAKHG